MSVYTPSRGIRAGTHRFIHRAAIGRLALNYRKSGCRFTHHPLFHTNLPCRLDIVIRRSWIYEAVTQVTGTAELVLLLDEQPLEAMTHFQPSCLPMSRLSVQGPPSLLGCGGQLDGERGASRANSVGDSTGPVTMPESI